MNMHLTLSDRECVPSRTRAGEAAAGRRLELLWAWASLLALIVGWDAARRLDERVPLPRVRIAHAVDMERSALPAQAGGQKALMPVRARPTVN